MDTNNNLENNVGSESLGAVETPVNAEPVNNMGEETFSPFQDLNSAPLNVPTETQDVAPQMDTISEVSVDTPAAVSNTDSLNSFMNPEPVATEPASTFEVPQAEPSVAAFNPAPVEPVQTEPTVENFASAPAMEPVQSVPTMDTFAQTPTAEPVSSEPQAAMGLNDLVQQNTTAMPVVEDTSSQGPTLPIPDQMPTNDYQAGVSTPVDYATPMSDFDQIGTTPELDPNAKGKKKSNKLALVILLLAVIGGLGYGAYYFINVKGLFNSDSVKVKDVVAEKGETLSTNIDDYATFKNTSSSNCVLKTDKVDITKIGSYEFTVTCGKKSYTGKVNVKDTKAPEIKVKTNVVIAGTTLSAEMLVSGSNETATYAYASETETENYKTAGLKSIKLNATDENSNTKTYYVPVIVTSSEYSMGIVSKKAVDLDNVDAAVTEKNVILYNNSAGIVNDTSYTAYIIKFNNPSAYSTVVKSYNGEATLTYNSYTGTPIFDNDTNTIVLVKDINTDLIKDNYNETFNNVNNNNGYQAFLISQTGANKELIDFDKI